MNFSRRFIQLCGRVRSSYDHSHSVVLLILGERPCQTLVFLSDDLVAPCKIKILFFFFISRRPATEGSKRLRRKEIRLSTTLHQHILLIFIFFFNVINCTIAAQNAFVQLNLKGLFDE